MQKPILLLGGRGKVGRHLSAKLSQRQLPHVIATREPRGDSERLFDWERPETFVPAFEGIGALYIVAPTNRADHHVVVPPALALAKDMGVKRFVLLSAASLPKGGVMMGAIHQWLADHTPEWAVLRPSWFMQNIFEPRHATSIAENHAIYSATGSAKLGFIDAADIAQCALSALTDEIAWNTDEILTGPQALSYSDLADEISRQSGKHIEHRALSIEDLTQQLERTGLNRQYAEILANMDGVIAQSPDEQITDAVYRRTGLQPSTFAAILLREAKLLPKNISA